MVGEDLSQPLEAGEAVGQAASVLQRFAQRPELDVDAEGEAASSHPAADLPRQALDPADLGVGPLELPAVPILHLDCPQRLRQRHGGDLADRGRILGAAHRHPQADVARRKPAADVGDEA